MLDMVLTTAILLRFLLFPGAFSLLCFSEGKCFITREWNTPLKERYEEEKTETETFILTAKRSGHNTWQLLQLDTLS